MKILNMSEVLLPPFLSQIKYKNLLDMNNTKPRFSKKVFKQWYIILLISTIAAGITIWLCHNLPFLTKQSINSYLL